MNRKFGVEFEACLVVEYDKDNNWLDYIKLYLETISINLFELNNFEFTNTFENTVIIKTEKNDEHATIYKYNLLTNVCHEDKFYEIDYKCPIISPDYSVVCHDYKHGFFDIHQHPSEYNYMQVNKLNYKLEKDIYSVNIEIISHILDNFEDYHKFKDMFIPHNIDYIYNKSQGVHLNIDIHNISTLDLKFILLNKYIPWENEFARIVRPIKSRYAMEFDKVDISRIEKANTLNQLAIVLDKYRSVNIKTDIDVIEFRIFSMLGTDVDYYMQIVYEMFSIKSKGGGKSFKNKKMKIIKNKTRNRKHY